MNSIMQKHFDAFAGRVNQRPPKVFGILEQKAMNLYLHGNSSGKYDNYMEEVLIEDIMLERNHSTCYNEEEKALNVEDFLNKVFAPKMKRLYGVHFMVRVFAYE